MKRKLFYLLLCLCVITMMIPSAAFAFDTESTKTIGSENGALDLWTLPGDLDLTAGSSVSALGDGVTLSAAAKPAPGEVSTWEELQAAMNNGNSAILMADITCPADGSALVLPAGKIFTLDLNGHTIDRGLTKATENGYVIQVNSSLTIDDTSPTGLGKITGGNNIGGGGGIYCVSGTVILKGGSICGNKAAYGGGICVETSSSTVSLNGGTICHNTVTGNGGGIWTSHDCYSVAFGDPNAGYAECPGTVVSDNIAFGSGGGFYGACELLMYRGAFKNNTAYVNGGAICYSFESPLSSKTLIRLWDYSAPVEITGNRAGSNGGGIYLYERTYTPHLYFCIGNKVILKDNTDLTGTQMSNAFLGDGIGIYIVGYNYLSADSEVHVTESAANIPLKEIAITGAVGGSLSYGDYPQIVFDEPKADAFPVVYFGSNTEGEKDAIAWYLLPQTNHNEGDAYFLWSKYSVGSEKFESVDVSVMETLEVPEVLKDTFVGTADNLLAYMNLVFGNNTKHTWWNSTARVWLNGDFYNGAFSTEEKTGILQTKVTNFHTIMDYDGCALDDKVFLLSAEELVSTKYGFIDNLTTMEYFNHRDSAKAGSTEFMMRTPYGDATGTNAAPGVISMSGTFYENPQNVLAIQMDYPLRPGINLDKDKVPFFLPAVNANSNAVGSQLSAMNENNAEWKVALETPAMAGFIVNYQTTGVYGEINFNYIGGTVGENNYISAVVLDELGTVKYMGNLAKAKDNGNVSIDLTNLDLKDSDRLYVYCSQENGDYNANYCSNPVELDVPHSHSMIALEKTDATCIAQGIAQDCFYCADCDKYFADENGSTALNNAITAPLGHSWTTEYTSENADAIRHYYVCTLCGVKDEGEEHDSLTGCSVCGKTTSEMSRINAVFQNGGTVKLTQDIVFAAGEMPFIADGVSVVLDLNGHTIDRNGANAPNYYSETFIVRGGGSLTIKDSSSAQTGKITGSTGNGTNNQYGLSVISVQNGTLNLEGGSISDNGRTAIMVSYTSALNMSGGTISNNRSSGSGGGINARITSAGGAAVNITGGTITNNYAAGNGGGICGDGGTNGKGSMILDGVTITNNTAGNCGGGVYYGGSANATLTIKNTTITGNGIRSARNNTTNMTGYGVGGGLCLSGATVPVLSGKVIVKDNYAGVTTNDSNVDDVNQNYGNLLIVSGVLTNGSYVSAEAGNYTFATCDNANSAAANKAMFHSDDCDTVSVSDNRIVLNGVACSYGSAFTGSDGTYHYKVCTKCGSFGTEKNDLNARHSGGTATCAAKAVCTTCNRSYGDLLSHSGGTATCTKQAVCVNCGQSYGDLLSHSGGSATCNKQAVCDNCGQSYGGFDLTKHTPEEDDGNCTTDILCVDCGEVAVEGNASHRGGEATCKEYAKCDDCGSGYGVLKDHSWKDADCDDPKTCSVCGKTEGYALGHDWGLATCTDPQSCEICGATRGEPLGHDWLDADCDTPKTCDVCGVTEGAALGHDWLAADCDTAKTCDRCGTTEGEALGHDWLAADCDTPKTCDRCGETEGEALGHDWLAADCDTPKTCDVCGETEGEPLGHDWLAADCDTPKTCDVCGVTEGESLGHDWLAADCDTAKTCDRCGTTEGEPLGHDWLDADCDDPKTCDRCGETEGEPLGHDWLAADCDTPKTCDVCGETEGEPLGHEWLAADCDTAKICDVCGETEGEPLGHDWLAADCDTPQTCDRCGVTEGEPLGHDWLDADCDDPKTCDRCGETEGEALGHEWLDADCDTPKTCDVCGATEGEALGHKWDAADCDSPRTCSVCGETDGEALGHDWLAADCDTPKTCDRCGETEGEALGHDWLDADCDDPKTCDRCGETEGEALGHDWLDADCDTPKTCDVCGETDGEPLGHDWLAADCDTAKTCDRCGTIEGEPLGHDWLAADCDTPQTCDRCGVTEGEPLGHDWLDADCDDPKTCDRCGETEGEPLGHEWLAADCDTPKACDVCGATEGEALGHDWLAADCDTPKTCDVCGATEGEALGHDWNEAYGYDENGHYLVCGACGAEDAAEAHTPGAEATATTPQTCVKCDYIFVNAYGHPVTFDMNGHGASISPISVADGSKLDVPAEPVEIGYTFGGWYKEETLETLWDFDVDTVTSATTLYAKWTVNQYTITFDPDGGSEVAAITADYGAAIIAPADPVKTGHSFLGWDKAIPETMPAEDIILTALWEINTYLVSFDLQGHGEPIASAEVTYGEKAAKPESPAEEGWLFGGWYLDAECTEAYDFNAAVSASFTLYAKWTEATCDGGEDCPISDFEDAEAGAWYHEGVHYCLENGIMIGYEDGTFRPSDSATRAQILMMLWKLDGSPVGNGEWSFLDVSADAWYADAVAWAYENGLAKGYSESFFGPDRPITREEMAVFMYRYANYKGYDMTVSEDIDLTRFADHEMISEWAMPALEWAVDRGLMNGHDDGTLDASGNSTRAQVAMVFQRFCCNIK